MPRSEAENERIRAAQRTAILAVPRTVFAQRGLTATIDDVAAAAGVSHGLAYRYFASKAELLRALAEEALTALADSSHACVLRALVADRRDHSEMLQLLSHVLADPSVPADLTALAERRGREFRGQLRGLITEGQASGEVAGDDPDQLVTVISVDGLGRLSGPQRRQGEAVFPSAEIVLRTVMKPGQAAGRSAAESKRGGDDDDGQPLLRQGAAASASADAQRAGGARPADRDAGRGQCSWPTAMCRPGTGRRWYWSGRRTDGAARSGSCSAGC